MIEDISVGVFIHEKVRKDCQLIKDSWVVNFKNYLFLASNFDRELPSITPDLILDDTYDKSTDKFFYCFKKQLEKHSDCKWFFSCGYDVFLHSTNLVNLLKKFDSNKDYYIGGHGDIRTINGLTVEFASGGPGIVLSKPTLEKLVPNIEKYLEEWKDPNLSGQIGYFTPDVAIAYFLKRDFNISLTNVEGFYFFNYDSYLQEDSHHHNKFKLIDDPISFHNVKPVLEKVPEHKARAEEGTFPYNNKVVKTRYKFKKDDIITGDKFREFATCILDGSPVEIKISPKNNLFFINIDHIPLFAEKVLPSINYPFKIITHNGDNPVREEFRFILDNPNLVRWYGMNAYIQHPKLVPIPIGMANEKWAHGNKDELVSVINKRIKKKNLVYSNFEITTNINYRLSVLHTMKSKDFVTCDDTKQPYKNYLETVASYKYIISPPGNGVDCHRIWESIYIGTIPIVQKSLALDYFKDLPILWVNDFSEVTKQLLEENEHLIDRPTHKAMFSFYKNLIV